KEKKSNLSLDERLANYIIEGSKEGLVADLDLKLKEAKPLAIINGPLMAGMDEVGRLFNNNELIVAEVLQSAEAMKAAVAHLEPLMEKSESSSRGKVVLATVKGDVHDIGKNLVDIILSNNGFTVINLGIKIPPEQLIAAIKEHNPDIVGLSGLLVKSAQQMVITAEDLAKHGIQKPILVGGAALSQKFTDKKIARAYEGFVTYARDAMNGLDLAKQIQDPHLFTQLKKSVLKRQQEGDQDLDYVEVALPQKNSQERSSSVEVLQEVPQAPDWQRHLISNTPVEQIWEFINPLMLYSRHLGLKGKHAKLLAQGNFKEVQNLEGGAKAIQIWETLQELKTTAKSVIQAKAIYQFFPAYSEGNTLYVLDSKKEQVLGSWKFPRQSKDKRLCLADYLQSPPLWQKDKPDNLALFVVTAGSEYQKLSQELKEKGEYLKSHALAALALETAEAYAEYLHSRLRSAWGFADPLDMKMIDRFQAKYRGKRYSFGYPACPELKDQELLWKLLKPQEIGVNLTEGFMMEPEASVSALVFHHNQAEYFGANK
ncbi:MAG: B12-binding domain-containing protein, partial [Deltaproteobacteria bacterium]|nr:B12-binding domain-containing protein [Deltaproteobacteria bacterium]